MTLMYYFLCLAYEVNVIVWTVYIMLKVNKGSLIRNGCSTILFVNAILGHTCLDWNFFSSLLLVRRIINLLHPYTQRVNIWANVLTMSPFFFKINKNKSFFTSFILTWGTCYLGQESPFVTGIHISREWISVWMFCSCLQFLYKKK